MYSGLYGDNFIGKQRLRYDGSHWYSSVRYKQYSNSYPKVNPGAWVAMLSIGIESGEVVDVESGIEYVKDFFVKHYLRYECDWSKYEPSAVRDVNEYFGVYNETEDRSVSPLRAYLKEVLELIVAENNPKHRSKLEKLISDYLAEEGLLLKNNPELESELKKVISNYYLALKARRDRFRQRAIINNYNYFVTFTRDDSKIESFEEFENKLKNTLKNLKQNHGWKYQGAFEWSDNGRLHAHLLLYIPDGELPGTLSLVDRYSYKKHKMVKVLENDYFRERIGMNDFEPISRKELLDGRTVNYILKYITKSTDQIYYCRGLEDSLEIDVDEYEISTVLRYKYCARLYFYDSDFEDKKEEYVNNPNVNCFGERWNLIQGSFL